MSKVTIIIPTYNRSSLVQETIDSVLGQTYQDFELIVVDDGSTDQTQQVLQERYGSMIRYIFQENQGESAARNHGISLAQGELIAFLDSDDLWLPQKLERQVGIMEADGHLGLVSTHADWINYAGLRLKRSPHGTGQKGDHLSWDELVLDNIVAGGGSSALVRRSVLDVTGGFDKQIRFGEEWDLWLRICAIAKLYQIQEPLVLYRLNPFGTRSWAPRANEAEAMFREHLAILAKAFAQRTDSAIDGQVLRDHAIGCVHLRYAYANYGLGLVEQGKTHWETALSLWRQHAANRDVIRQSVINYSVGYASVAEPGFRVKRAKTIVADIMENLPCALAQMQAERKALTAAVLAELAFHAATHKDVRLARASAAHCLRMDPLWASNLGFLKILVNGGRHLWPEPIQ